jgi:2-polyprenyl-6-methoxyphenol hydroxylase-like FAD-dependent oxidoreductase
LFRESPEVLIAGAGPVGQFAALTLAHQGVPVQIIDTGIWPCQRSYALALHPQTVKMLRGMNLADPVLAAALPVRTLALFDRAGRRAQIELEEEDAPLAVVRQDVIEKLLEGELEKEGVRIAWRHELAGIEQRDGDVAVEINRYDKEARGYTVAHTEWVIDKTLHEKVKFVIGADGHDSRVRRAAGINFPEVGPPQYYAVFEFSSDAGLGHEVRLVLGEKTTDVLWPLPNGGCRWSFELPDYHDTAAEKLKDFFLSAGFGYFPTEREKDRMRQAGDSIPELDESHLKELLAQRAPWFSGNIASVTWRTVVRFERRLASAYGQGRLWLAGDAAHLTGPAGIQSMNAGLFEARHLADTIGAILREKAPLTELQIYNERWLGVWRQLHQIGGGLQARAGADPWIAARAPHLVSALPAHGPALAALAAQVGLEASAAAQAV